MFTKVHALLIPPLWKWDKMKQPYSQNILK